VITVDDGFTDFVEQALPPLLDRGQTATLYVPTAYVGRTSRWLTPEGEGNRAVLSWAQLRAVADAGVECGGHSHSHAQLDLLPTSALDGEIRGCKSRLEDGLGRPVRAFAYPFGYSNRRVRRLVTDAGYDSACSVRDLQFQAGDSPWSMSRWTITAAHGPAQLEALLTHQRTVADQARSGARAVASHVLRRARLRKPARVTRGHPDLATTETS
jgi:peptidoglycan/xylan/chitin deacetylase (PgdA/CDA1 family)